MQAAHRDLLTLVALWGAGLGAGGQFAKLSVPFDTLAGLYPDAGASLGLMVSILSAMGVICGFFAGLLVARLGYRRLLLWALWGGAMLSALQALMPAVPIMLSLRFVEGVSHLIIVVAAPTLMAQIATDRTRPAVMTIWSTFFGVAFAAVAFWGLPLVAREGLASLLVVHAVFMACVAAILTLILPALPSGARSAAPLSLAGVLRAHGAAYRSPAKSAPAFGWLCYTLTYVALLTVLPGLLAPEDRGWASALMPLAGLAVSMTLGIWLLRTMSGVTLCVVGFALGAALSATLWTDPDNAMLAVMLMGCLGLVQSGSFAAIPALNAGAAEQAEANGAMAQMGNLGNLLGTPVMLGLVALGGNAAIFAGLILAYVAGVGLHLVQARRRTRVT